MGEVVLTAEEIALLTQREQQILLLIRAEHLSDQQIADRLGIRKSTVKTHVHNFRRRLRMADKRARPRKALYDGGS